MGLQGFGYKVDIVFVIDATGSMTPIMNEVRRNALSLGDKICDAMKAEGKLIDQLRLRVIDFADFATEGDEAIRQTDFFDNSTQKADFEHAINAITIDGRGGDVPENALEALFAAINSDWVDIDVSKGEKGRHIIVLMTDAVPLHLHERDGCIGYCAEDYPDNIEQLSQIWHANSQDATTKLSPSAKRLVLYAPDGEDKAGHSWAPVRSWEWATGAVVDAATGLEDINIDIIIKEIVRSL